MKKLPQIFHDIRILHCFFMHVHTNIPINFCLRFLNIPRYVITSSLKKFLPFLFNFYMTKQGVIHLGSQN